MQQREETRPPTSIAATNGEWQATGVQRKFPHPGHSLKAPGGGLGGGSQRFPLSGGQLFTTERRRATLGWEKAQKTHERNPHTLCHQFPISARNGFQQQRHHKNIAFGMKHYKFISYVSHKIRARTNAFVSKHADMHMHVKAKLHRHICRHTIIHKFTDIHTHLRMHANHK